MKKLISVVLIILIFFPMLLYLNPFVWGMRRMPYYQPNQKTVKLISELNRKHQLEMRVGEVIDTLWYFRDFENKKLDTLQNFELNLISNEPQKVDLEQVKNYVDEFKINFMHQKYFDSITITMPYDSIIYKTKMQ